MLFLDVWGAETNLLKQCLGIYMDNALFLIALFFADKNEKK